MTDNAAARDRTERSGGSAERSINGQDIPQLVKPTRSYRACINCRTHKTKCDLGDVNNPISPPCSRCKRERKECVFGESRRGGRANIEAGLAKRKANSEAPRDLFESTNGGLHQGDTRNGEGQRRTTTPGARVGSSNEAPSYATVPPPDPKLRPHAPPLAVVGPSRQVPLRQAPTNMTQQSDRQFSPLMTFDDNDTSYMPMFGSTTSTVPRPYAHALSPRTMHQAQGGYSGFPLSMDDIDMSFVFNARNTSGLIMDHSNGGPSAGSLPSVNFPEENTNHNIPTGPSFSGFFASPEVQHEPVVLPNANQRQADSTPQGIPSDPEHHLSSSKTRKMSTSTTDSAVKERVHSNEKLALKDPRSFVINAGMHNESDALQILAMAAETQTIKKRKRDASSQADSPNVETGERVAVQTEGEIGNGTIGEKEDSGSNWKSSRVRRRTPPFGPTLDGAAGPSASRVTFRESTSSGREDSPTPPPDITHFFLVEQGIVDPEQVHSLCRSFFDKHHHHFVSTCFGLDASSY